MLPILHWFVLFLFFFKMQKKSLGSVGRPETQHSFALARCQHAEGPSADTSYPWVI